MFCLRFQVPSSLQPSTGVGIKRSQILVYDLNHGFPRLVIPTSVSKSFLSDPRVRVSTTLVYPLSLCLTFHPRLFLCTQSYAFL